MRLSVADAETLATDALAACGTRRETASATARALVRAEIDGQRGHGLNRVPYYAAQAKSGKVNGQATPDVQPAAPALLRVDAGYGFAYPAIAAAIERLGPLAGSQGIAAAVIRRSHHFGQAGAHAEALAESGLIGLALGNSPKAMAFWGGKRPMIGTNPIGFAAPIKGQPPLVIDLATSQVARGKVMAAKRAGEPIPEGWALDADGTPTTDSEAALAGTMAPMGGAKGAALAMMIEVLAAGLSGSAFGFEAGSFFDAAGAPPDIGHLLIAINPGVASGGAFADRMMTLVAAVESEDGARLPGSRRLALRAAAQRDGLDIPDALHTEIQELAHGG